MRIYALYDCILFRYLVVAVSICVVWPISEITLGGILVVAMSLCVMLHVTSFCCYHHSAIPGPPIPSEPPPFYMFKG